MADSTEWQTPGELPDVPPGSPTAAASPAPAPTAAGTPAPPPPTGAPLPPPPAPGAIPAWTPPPKPGLIPLRPLTLGAILGASFQVLRRNPRPVFGTALVIALLLFVLTTVFTGAIVAWAFNRIDSITPDTADADAVQAGALAAVIVGTVLVAAANVWLTAVLQGVIAAEVATGTVGRKLTFRGLWRACKHALGWIFLWALLLLAAAIVAYLVFFLVIALAALAGPVGLALGLLVGFLGGIGIVALAAWLLTKTAFVPSVLVIERARLGAALARSWRLTVHYFWRVFGIRLLVFVMVQVAIQIVSIPASLALELLLPNLLPTDYNDYGSPDDALRAMGAIIPVYLVLYAITALGTAVGLVVISATDTLLYIDLRMRREGLDLELSRYVEARAAGDESVPDPYLLRTAPPPDPSSLRFGAS